MDYNIVFYRRSDLFVRYKDIPIQKIATYHIMNMNVFTILIDTIGIFIDIDVTLNVKYSFLYRPGGDYTTVIKMCTKKYKFLNETNFVFNRCTLISPEASGKIIPSGVFGVQKPSRPSFILSNVTFS